MRSQGMDCNVDRFMDALSDSDWAGCPTSRRSHTGFMVRAGGSLVSWTSKRQTTYAQSTAEAEYMAAAATANEIVWWRRLCDDFGFRTQGPVTLWCDNKSAELLADHEGKFERAKHIQLRYHVLREYQRTGVVNVRWCSAQKMAADVLTKNCPPRQFREVVSGVLGEVV